jgi:8-oxo-dGTP pyrophosphatase MutT (NUDIX family)
VKIVTVFLEWKGRYVIMHRADSMPTYPKKWSAISGHIEEGEDVIQAGLRELSEETGISKNQIEVMKTSKRILVPAPEYKKLWVINPMLVRLKKEHKIKLDSENTEFRWVTPDEMKEFDLVPSVYGALMSLLR